VICQTTPPLVGVAVAVDEADALGVGRERADGLVRRPEKKYAKAPALPRATNATTATSGIQSFRDIDPIIHLATGG
jgi:hypothetical protein